MIKLSTQFKESILGANSFASIFEQGRILVYDGAQPESADAAVTGTLLGQITSGGLPWAANGSAGGLSFTQIGAWISKNEAQNWKFVASAAGTPGWFRLVGKAQDDGFLSYNAPRIDGAIGSDMVLAVTTTSVGTNLPVQQFLFTFPPALGV